MKLVLEVKVKANDGIPTMFLTAQKDGKAFDVLYSSDMTLSEIFKRFDLMTTESKDTSLPPASMNDLMDKTIRKGDLVKFIADVDPESGSDLKTGGVYQAVSVSASECDIVDPETRFRSTVLKKDIEFYQKANKSQPKSIVLETVKTCACGEQVVCQKIDGEYFGKCECGIEVTVAVTA